MSVHSVNYNEAISKATHWAEQNQHPKGYWRGNCQSNNTMEAEYILISYLVGREKSPEIQKVVKRILDCQHEDGTWGMYYEADGDLSTTIECYFALKMVGKDTSSPLMRKAREFILANGGVDKSRIFTKFWLALFGQWPWEKIPLLPPEIIFLPNWFIINIYEFASWARAAIVPIGIIMTSKPVCHIPRVGTIPELFVPSLKSQPPTFPFFSMKNFFWQLDKLLHLYEKSPWKPFRKRAREKCLEWTLERQQADGTWAGNQVGWVYPILALHALGHQADNPLIKKCFAGVLENYSHDINGGLIIQASDSPVWDTCLMLTALFDSGTSINSPMVKKGIDFLLQNQIFAKGDWQVKNPNGTPGGWIFEFANSYYPDIDDTAEVLTTLSRYQKRCKTPDPTVQTAINKGVAWMLSMQCKNGGWAAFDKDNTNTLVVQLPFFDFGELLDPPSVDVTVHVLEALGELGFKADHPQIAHALNYILSEQETDGSWFGRWGVNYIYGTSAVIIGLKSLNFNMQEARFLKAYNWLLGLQNPDGGWGESCSSYVALEDRGKGASTASQTAWALMALIVGGYATHDQVIKGVAYLSKTIGADGIWDEPYYTATGFAGYLTGKRPEQMEAVKHLKKTLSTGFMLRYDLYRHYWPLRALGMYQAQFR